MIFSKGLQKTILLRKKEKRRKNPDRMQYQVWQCMHQQVSIMLKMVALTKSLHQSHQSLRKISRAR